MQMGKVTHVIWPVCMVFLFVQALAFLWVKEQHRQSAIVLQKLDRQLVKEANFWETLMADKHLLAAYVRVEELAKSQGMVRSEQHPKGLVIHE